MLKQEQLYIKGMTCINCQNRIEDALKKNAGVTNVWVNYEEGIASVSYQTETTTTEELAKVIEALGYEVSFERNSKGKVVFILLIAKIRDFKSAFSKFIGGCRHGI